MESARILVIDDSRTILKMVECHLSQAGYSVATAPTAEEGIAAAAALSPDLILLDHQLPGTTGDEVCRRLLENEATAQIPVVISSAMRNRAFASYTEFPNVVDQIPKPFTPDLLKTGVANALEVGALVVRAQRTGCAMPDTVDEPRDAALEGQTAAFPLRAVIDFLNNTQTAGRLTLEIGNDRIRFCLASGRIQAVLSPTIPPDTLDIHLPDDLADLAPLLAVTLGERVDPSMSGLVRLLERSLDDPRRLRALLRVQAAILTHRALTARPGTFRHELDTALPPMFQAFPLQISLPALAIEGIRRCDPTAHATPWAALVFARTAQRGASPDRAGLTPAELKLQTTLDGSLDLATAAARAGIDTRQAADIVRGLELVGLVERRAPSQAAAVLAMEDDAEAAGTLQRVLGEQGESCRLKLVRDPVSTQLLLKRGRYDLVLLAVDRPDAAPVVRACRDLATPGTRLVGITGLDGEDELARVDDLGLDGLLHRPIAEADLLATLKHLLPEPIRT